MFSGTKAQPRKTISSGTRASFTSARRINHSPIQARREVKIAAVAHKRIFEIAKTDAWHSSGWNVSQTNINWDIRQGLGILRSKSRELAENDPYFKKFMRELEKNVIGPEGFTHRNKAFDWKKDNAGGWKKVYDKVVNTMIQDGFWDWSQMEYCYVSGDMSLTEGLGVELKTIATDGEVFLKKIYTTDKKENPFGITYQQIEAAFCDETYNKLLPNGNIIIMGIEYTPVRKPVAYYFRKIKEGAELYSPYASKEYVRIPADQIIHLFIKEFVGQLRGIPWCAPTGLRLHLLRGYEDAALNNARSAARKSNMIEPVYEQDGELSTATVAGSVENENGDLVQNIQPGKTFIVPYGYKHVAYDPTYPQGEHGPFTQTILQGVSSGWDIDYPTLSSNLSGVNYTSARHGLLDSRLGYRIYQRYLREHRLNPTFRDWLESTILNGYFSLPIKMSNFQKYNQPMFLGFVGEWVDKYKDAKGTLLELQGNLTTYEIELSKRGLDFDEVVERITYERKLLIENGLLPSDLNKEVGSSTGNDGGDESVRSLVDVAEIAEVVEDILDDKLSNKK